MRIFLGSFVIACAAVLAGCQAIQATSAAVASSNACTRSGKSAQFPAEGERRAFDVRFRLSSVLGEHLHEDRVTCRYEGSMCGGGTWFHVWREDRLDGFEQAFPGGDMVSYHYHSFCANLLLRPGSGAEQRFVLRREGAHPRALSFDELGDRGIHVESFTIEAVTDAL